MLDKCFKCIIIELKRTEHRYETGLWDNSRNVVRYTLAIILYALRFIMIWRKQMNNIRKLFARYVSLNILGMIGLSCYVLADSFFISLAKGADGLTALNLVLPLYNLIFAIGSMIGVGSAIRFAIARARGDKDCDNYLPNALFFTTVIGLVFSIAGILFPDKILMVLGADDQIVSVGTTYTRIFMSFAPIFMWNYVANAYVRNDGAPSIAMAATLSSSLFNILFDYVLMFPLGLGMTGAALATALSPIIGISVCLVHLLSKKSNVKIKMCRPSLKRLSASCQVGVAAFVAEISSGVITLIFNFIILKLAGNIGVAAYGIVANVSLVAVAVFNGVAQGSQPLVSSSYGKRDMEDVRTLKRLSFATTVTLAIVMYTAIFIFTHGIVKVFNSENSVQLTEYAVVGVRLYFTGILFAGINIVGGSYLSATEKAKGAFIVSVLRGFILITSFAFIMSILFGMNGVWLSYMAAELCTTIVFLILNGKYAKNEYIN